MIRKLLFFSLFSSLTFAFSCTPDEYEDEFYLDAPSQDGMDNSAIGGEEESEPPNKD